MGLQSPNPSWRGRGGAPAASHRWARSGGAFLLAGAVCLACQSEAQAQSAPGDARGQSRTQLSGEVTTTYDTNIARASAAAAATRRLQQEDWLYNPGVTVDLLRPLGSQSVFLRGTAGYNFYGRNRRLNREAIELSAGASKFVRSCRATVYDKVSRSQSDLQTLGSLEEASLATNVQTSNSIGLDAGCAQPIGVTPILNISQQVTRNSADLRKRADYDLLVVGGGVSYQRPIFGSLSLTGQYRRTRFPNRPIIVGGALGDDGYRVYVGAVSFARNIGSRIQTSAQVSYTSLRPDLPQAPGFDGLTYAGSLTLVPVGRTRVKIDVLRSTTPSNQLNSAFSRDESQSIEISESVSRRLSFVVGASRDEKRYEGAALDPLTNLTHQRIDTVFAGAQAQVGRWFSVLLDVRRQDRSANLNLLGYRSTRVSLTLSGRF